MAIKVKIGSIENDQMDIVPMVTEGRSRGAWLRTVIKRDINSSKMLPLFV